MGMKFLEDLTNLVRVTHSPKDKAKDQGCLIEFNSPSGKASEGSFFTPMNNFFACTLCGCSSKFNYYVCLFVPELDAPMNKLMCVGCFDNFTNYLHTMGGITCDLLTNFEFEYGKDQRDFLRSKLGISGDDRKYTAKIKQIISPYRRLC